MTESAAMILYLGDLSDNPKLAPAITAKDRAAYLRLVVFMAANTYMTDLRYYYPHRYAGGEAHASDVVAKALEEQKRNWTALEGMADSHTSLLPSGHSAADLYLTMLVSWSQIEGFSDTWPKLHSIALRVSSLPELSEIWQRNDVVFR
jgi:glutathione S-transferase